MTNPNYNSNTTGGLLQGLGGLLQGINSLRDPKAEERARLQALLQQNPQLRDQYQQQYANNPDALKALLGTKPIFGRSNYDQLSSLITGGQVSPDMIRNQQINQLQAKGAINDNAGNIANASMSVPQLGQFSKSTIQGAANSGLGMTGEDTQNLTEFNALGRFLTPQERQKQESALAQQKADTERAITEAGVSKDTASSRIEGSKVDLATAQQNLASAKDKKTLEDTYRKTAQAVQARLGKGETLYSAYRNKKVSPDEFTAIQGNSETKNAFDASMMDYYKDLSDKRERELHNATVKSIKEQRVGTYAQFVMEKAAMNGQNLTYDQAVQMATDPSKADENTKAIMNGLNAKDKEATVLKFKGEFLRQASPILQQLAKPGANADPNLIQQLNNASVDNTPPGYEPVIYGIHEVQTPGKIWGMHWPNKQNVPVILSGDKDLVKASGVPQATKDTIPRGGQPGQLPPNGLPPGSPNQSNPGPSLRQPAQIGGGGQPLPQVNIDGVAQEAVDNGWNDAQITAGLNALGIKDNGQLLIQIKNTMLNKKKTNKSK